MPSDQTVRMMKRRLLFLMAVLSNHTPKSSGTSVDKKWTPTPGGNRRPHKPPPQAPTFARGAPNSGTGPVDGYLAEQTTTGTKTDTPLREVPQSVSVVGKQQMRDQGVQNLQEAFRYTPGIVADPMATTAVATRPSFVASRHRTSSMACRRPTASTPRRR